MRRAACLVATSSCWWPPPPPGSSASSSYALLIILCCTPRVCALLATLLTALPVAVGRRRGSWGSGPDGDGAPRATAALAAAARDRAR